MHNYLLGLGWYIVDTGKFFSKKGQGARFEAPGYHPALILPDILIAKNGLYFWVEIKGKQGGFNKFHKTNTWQTGLNCNAFDDYAILDTMGIPVLVCFVHWGHSDEPDNGGPAGLFVGKVRVMIRAIDHKAQQQTDGKWLYYWPIEVFIQKHDFNLEMYWGLYGN